MTLRICCGPFGKSVSTEIVTDPLGYSLGFGRAEMHNEEGADSVVKHLDGTAFHNGTIDEAAERMKALDLGVLPVCLLWGSNM